MKRSSSLVRERIKAGICVASILLLFCVEDVDCWAQAPVTATRLQEPQIPLGDAAWNRDLLAIERLVESQQWPTVLERWQSASADGEDLVVTVEGDEGLYRGFPTARWALLASLPKEVLELYRRQVDGTAESIYRLALNARDQNQLRKFVDDMLLSSFGDDALFDLGEFALQQGDFATARSCWQLLLTEKPWLDDNAFRYPDTDLPPAEIAARLVLVSLREGDLPQAQRELAELKESSPDAVGRIAGRQQSLVRYLEDRLIAAREQGSGPLENHRFKPPGLWPTIGGNPERSSQAGTGERPNTLAWSGLWKDVLIKKGADNARPSDFADAFRSGLQIHPVVKGDKVLLASRNRIWQLEWPGSADSGMNVVELYRPAADRSTTSVRARNRLSGVEHFTLSVWSGILYTRTGGLFSTDLSSAVSGQHSRLIAINLAAGGRLLFESSGDDGDWVFEGAPLRVGDSIYVGMKKNDIQPRAYVACFDAFTGELRWRTFVAGANTVAANREERTTSLLVARSGSELIYATDLGAIAAVSLNRGVIKWLRTYSRDGDAPQTPGIRLGPTPIVCASGTVVVAPQDSRQVYALDAATGSLLWSREFADERVAWLGAAVGENRVMAAGERLWWMELSTGEVVHRWPAYRQESLQPAGRPCIRGNVVYYPTKLQKIFCFDVKSGRPSAEPLDLQVWGGESGHLIPFAGGLLVEGATKLQFFLPRSGLAQSVEYSSDQGRSF